SAINGGGTGSFTGNLFAFDLIGSDTMIFRGPSQATLPPHEAARDLLRYVGTFGATPSGTVDFFFDGSTAGLAGPTVQALAFLAGSCGDGVVTPPFEECDLGSANGGPFSRCSANCQVVGNCTMSGSECESASDCPPGEGCCGNAVVEVSEECDDGNSIPDDLC